MYIVALEEEALQRRLAGMYAAHSDGNLAPTWCTQMGNLAHSSEKTGSVQRLSQDSE